MSEENIKQVENNAGSTTQKRLYTGTELILRIGIVVLIDLVFVCIWLFTTCKEEQFVAHFSFASTVTSIILSVLAIFLSISGEMKTQTIRDDIENEAKDISRVTRELEDKMVSLSEKIEIIHSDTTGIKAAVTVPGSGVYQVANSENK